MGQRCVPGKACSALEILVVELEKTEALLPPASRMVSSSQAVAGFWGIKFSDVGLLALGLFPWGVDSCRPCQVLLGSRSLSSLSVACLFQFF